MRSRARFRADGSYAARPLDSRQGAAVVMPTDLGRLVRPTIVAMWAPSCAECRAMHSDLAEVSKSFEDHVDVQMINVAETADAARQLRVMGTPTLIGIRGGEEIFRFAGRRSRSELAEMFTAVSTGSGTNRVGRQDALLRVAAGVLLIRLGFVAGSAWPLIGVGGVVVTLGLLPWLRQRE